MAHKEIRLMLQGALVMTIASFIAKLLSAVYRVPFQNLVGDEGFYVYQQVYPIYGIAMTLALSGLPQFISKIVAEQETTSEKKLVLQRLFPFVSAVGLGCFLFFFFGSSWLAYLMGDIQLASLIQVVSITFLLVPVLSFYRGNFQGHLLMTPSAVSQVLEQVIRVGVILLAAGFFKSFRWNVYQTGTMAMGGAVLGGAAAVFSLWYYDRKIQPASSNYFIHWKIDKEGRQLFHRLFIEGGLVSLYSAFLIVFQLVDSFFIKNALVLSGMTDKAAKIDKGIYDRGQPLVQLGLVVALALSSTFLPALTKYFIGKKDKQFNEAAKMFLRLTTTVASAASAGLLMLLPYINFALFKDYKGNGVLGLYVFAIAFMAIIQAYQSILQSKNNFKISFLAASAGILVKLLLTSIMTQRFGTVGSSLSTIFALLVTQGVLMKMSDRKLNQFWQERNFLKKLLTGLGIMVIVLLIYQGILGLIFGITAHRGLALIFALIGVGLGLTTFFFVIIQLRLFTVREWLMVPFGKKVLRMKKR
ncbi:putative polysaccharide biosynthesis protein [Enterococcus sp. CWB-B31]|uniref:putative polysaccharide biosynthesis protein n=1 Tax=Enterococcus sp. CWB-B31 TaxID=2885159 RepID=UPI001E5EB30C|nr:polysaccharide biosynthesis protein [Enterococcus sp. CWB-B31]MCB5953588.1 polysaccharide biosynthesis protein [Enterococcus sp. CWB-B31]